MLSKLQRLESDLEYTKELKDKCVGHKKMLRQSLEKFLYEGANKLEDQSANP
jgi:hypothetical protein